MTTAITLPSPSADEARIERELYRLKIVDFFRGLAFPLGVVGAVIGVASGHMFLLPLIAGLGGAFVLFGRPYALRQKRELGAAIDALAATLDADTIHRMRVTLNGLTSEGPAGI